MKVRLSWVRKVFSLALCALTATLSVPFSMTTVHAAGASELRDSVSGVTLYDRDGDMAYEIGTAEELLAFSALVSSGKKAIHAELTADIDMNPGYRFSFVADTGLIEVRKDDSAVAYLGTGIRGDSSGTGTKFDSLASSAYKIYANTTGNNGVLPADLIAWKAIGTPNYAYAGTFDGQNHTIRGLFYNASTSKFGLFGQVDGASVKNLRLENFCWNGNENLGGIIGLCKNATVENCTVDGLLRGESHLGGVVGLVEKSTIDNCRNDATIIGAKYFAGGIAGKTGNYDPVKLLNCANSGNILANADVTSMSESDGGVGGIIGSYVATGDDCRVQGCSNSGTIRGFCCVGGIAGNVCPGQKDDLIVSKCYNTGTVIGTQKVGGLAGYFCRSDMMNGYSTGMVTGSAHHRISGAPSEIGGLVGDFDNQSGYSSIECCYVSGALSFEGSAKKTGAIFGDAYSTSSYLPKNCYYLSESFPEGSFNGTSLSLDEMTSDTEWIQSFAGFDTTTPIWRKTPNASGKLYFPGVDDFSPWVVVPSTGHEHVWSYELSTEESKVTVTCNGENCDLEGENAGAITLSAFDTVYGDSTTNALASYIDWLPETKPDLLYSGVETSGKDYPLTATAPRNAGNYTVSLSFGTIVLTKSFQILPCEITEDMITVIPEETTYDGTQIQPHLTVKRNEVLLLPGTDYLSEGELQGINVKDYTITVKGIGNYSGSVEVSWKIKEKSMTDISAADITKVYDGQVTSILVTGAPDSAQIEYSLDGIIYLLTNPELRNVSDSATVFYRVRCENCAPFAGEATVTILPKAITVSADAKEMTFGQTEPALTYSVAGDPFLRLYGDLAREPGQDAGTYRIGQGTLTDANNPNYTITFCPGVLTITKAPQESPILSATAETVFGKEDGTISGLSDAMEISTDGETFAPVNTDPEVTYPAGSYFVRYAETSNYTASVSVRVDILPGRRLRILFPNHLPEGYRTEVMGTNAFGWQEGASFRVEILPGYSAENLIVTAQSGRLTDHGDGTYTISEATDDVSIFVSGVVDLTAPEVILTAKTIRWKQLFHKLTFGLFFRDNAFLQVTATDMGSGIHRAESLLSERPLSAEDLAETDAWTALPLTNDSALISIPAPDKKFVYVRVFDRAGNQTTVSSDGGIVVYSDVATQTEEIRYTKGSGAEIAFPITLEGNELCALYVGETVLSEELYSISTAGIVTVSAEYLNTLPQGETTLRLVFAPQGEIYNEYPSEEGNINDLPAELLLRLIVEKQAGTVEFTGTSDKIYDGKPAESPHYTTNSTGEVTVEWYRDQISAETKLSAPPTDAGTYYVCLHVASDDTAAECWASKAVTIQRRNISSASVVLTAPLIYTGQPLTQSITVTDPTGVPVDYSVTGQQATEVGVYTMTLSGRGNFCGEMTIFYRISPDTSALEGLTTENITSEHRAKIEALLYSLRSGEIEEIPQWIELEQKGMALLSAIETASKAVATEACRVTESISAETVDLADQGSLQTAKSDLVSALELHAGNYTSQEKENFRTQLQRIEAALQIVETVTSVGNQMETLPETIVPDQDEAVEKVEALYDLYADFSPREKGMLPAENVAKLERLLAASSDYEILQGDDASWEKEKGEPLLFVANGSCKRFVGLEIDGQTVPESEYEVHSGSTIVQIKEAYLQTLPRGAHTITFRYQNGAVSGTFQISSESVSGELPATGGSCFRWNLVAGMILSAGCLGLLLRKKYLTD